MSRDKPPLGADFCCFFRLLSWQGQRPGSWANLISSIGADEVCCTKPLLRFYRHGDGDCRATLSHPLRPRNILVPSYRPTQKGGCTFSMRQLASGSGEGQHTSPLCDHRRMSRSQSGCPIKRRGLWGHGLCAPGRSLTQRDHHFRALSSGSPRVRPVRRRAHPLCSRLVEKLGHIKRGRSISRCL